MPLLRVADGFRVALHSAHLRLLKEQQPDDKLYSIVEATRLNLSLRILN